MTPLNTKTFNNYNIKTPEFKQWFSEQQEKGTKSFPIDCQIEATEFEVLTDLLKVKAAIKNGDVLEDLPEPQGEVPYYIKNIIQNVTLD